MSRQRSRARAWAAGGAALLLTLSLSSVPALAQTETGRIVGTVADQQGGVLPGTTVLLTNTATGVAREAITDGVGNYFFANIAPGPYELRVELPGFATKVIRAQVQVGAAVTMNVTLLVAGATEAVEVLATAAALVNIANPEVATTITEQQVKELPTITRNIYDFVGTAGAAAPDDNSVLSNSTGQGAGFSISGQRAASTNILLDGSANNDEFAAGLGQAVPLDSVQEFSVITSNFSAQYGRATGGIVNVVTKSGTNDLKGSGYWFFRDEHLSTQTFDEKAQGLDKSPFDRNQWGASIGGPLQRDRMFFFGSVENIRVRSLAQDRSLVPTNEFIARMSPVSQRYFNQYQHAPINGQVIRAGDIAGVTPGGAFSALPSDLPVFGEIIRDLPADAGGGLPVDEWQFVGRMDWAMRNRSSVYFRYAMQDQQFPVGTNSDNPWEGFDTGSLGNNHNLLGSWTEIWSNNFTTQTKVVFNRLKNEQPLGEQAATPGLYMRTSRTSIDGIRVALPGYLPYSPGSAIPFGGPQQLLQVYEDATRVWGNHDLRMGGSYVYIMDDRMFGAFENSVQTLGGSLGQALDNLLLGQTIRFQGAVDPGGRYPGETITLPVASPSFERNNRYHEFAVYANDNWRIGNRLTLTLGARWEYYGVQHNTDPSLDANFYPGTGSTLAEQYRNGRIYPAPDSPIGGLWKKDWNNVAPRVGLAWDVRGDGRTSVRAGYGMAYERNFGNVTFNIIQNPPNYAVVSLVAPADVPVLPIYTDNAGPLAGTGSKVLPATSTRNVDPNITNAYAHFWSASFQHELFKNTAVSVEYVGSAGRNLYSLTNLNRIGMGAVYLGDSNPDSRPNAQYSNMNTRGQQAYSDYHGLSVGFETRQLADKGLYLTGRYTLSRAKDNLSTTFSSGNNVYNLGLLDPYDPDLDYGYADFDVRHRVTSTGIWELPFARGATGSKGALLGGWQLAYTLTAQTGAPFTIYDCSNAIDIYCARMLVVGSVADYQQRLAGTNQYSYLDLSNQSSGIGTIAGPNGSNEVPPAGGWPANMSERGAFRRPGRWNVDTAFSKRFRLGHGIAAQVRLEVYNLFNHANLYLADDSTDISADTMVYAVRGYTSSYGVVGDGQRRMQIGVKLEF